MPVQTIKHHRSVTASINQATARLPLRFAAFACAGAGLGLVPSLAPVAHAQLRIDGPLSRAETRVIATDLKPMKTNKTIAREIIEGSNDPFDEFLEEFEPDDTMKTIGGFEHNGNQVTIVKNAPASVQRSIDPWSVGVDGQPVQNPLQGPLNGTVILDTCNASSVIGVASAAVVGTAKSRVELLRDNEVIAALEKRLWGRGDVKTHEFTINAIMPTGDYRLRQSVIVFGNTPFNSGSTPFRIENSAVCASRLTYFGHVQSIGNMGWLPEGSVLGTTGNSKRLEAFRVKVIPQQESSIGVCYRAHVRGHGWQGTQCNGGQAGTTGQARRMEAITMYLTNQPAGCSIRYRVHMRGRGWGPWVSNGAQAGTTGEHRRIEALQAELSGSC